MSKEMLKNLIDIIAEDNIDTIFKVLIRFVPEDEPFPDKIKVIEATNKSIRGNGTIPHQAINWD